MIVGPAQACHSGPHAELLSARGVLPTNPLLKPFGVCEAEIDLVLFFFCSFLPLLALFFLSDLQLLLELDLLKIGLVVSLVLILFPLLQQLKVGLLHSLPNLAVGVVLVVVQQVHQLQREVHVGVEVRLDAQQPGYELSSDVGHLV